MSGQSWKEYRRKNPEQRRDYAWSWDDYYATLRAEERAPGNVQDTAAGASSVEREMRDCDGRAPEGTRGPLPVVGTPECPSSVSTPTRAREPHYDPAVGPIPRAGRRLPPHEKLSLRDAPSEMERIAARWSQRG